MRNIVFTILMLFLFLASISANGFPICLGAEDSPDYTNEIEWKFSLEPDRIYVEQVVTQYPQLTPRHLWVQRINHSDYRPQNITAWDFKTKEPLMTERRNIPGGESVVVHFIKGVGENKFVLSYSFDPTGNTGGGEDYDFFNWKWEKEYRTGWMNVVTILPNKYAFDKAYQDNRSSLDIIKYEKQGRNFCEFEMIAKDNRSYRWTIYYELRLGDIIINVSSPRNDSEVSGLVEIMANASKVMSKYEILPIPSSSLRYKIDNTDWIEFDDEKIIWDTSNVPNGVHYIAIGATDSEGNSVMKQISVYVNNTSPTTTLYKEDANGWANFFDKKLFAYYIGGIIGIMAIAALIILKKFRHLFVARRPLNQ